MRAFVPRYRHQVVTSGLVHLCLPIITLRVVDIIYMLSGVLSLSGRPAITKLYDHRTGTVGRSTLMQYSFRNMRCVVRHHFSRVPAPRTRNCRLPVT